MQRLIKIIRAIKNDLAKTGYVCKDHEGNPFFGEIRISLNDGKLVYMKNKDNGEHEVTENIKL